jgi:uncharacterized protein YerC
MRRSYQSVRMAKVKTTDIPKEERERILSEFLGIVSDLKSKDEVVDFLLGTLTPSEVLMSARRIQVASMLLRGKTYDDIRGRLGVGYQNIVNIDRWLHSGNKENDDWKAKLLRRVGSAAKPSVRAGRRAPSMSLLNKYAHHRLLTELLSELLLR